MTETEQRIAIAEADGWRHTTDGSDFWMHPDGRRVHGDNGRGTHLPDYLNDLNAMREARRARITTPELRYTYMNHLRTIVGQHCEKNKVGAALVTDYDCVDATAQEHAEAFLRTLGLWKD